MHASSRPARGAIYRHAHWYVLSLFIVVFAGFFRTYFSRLGSTDLIHHLHAITAIGWMLLVVLQSWFITHGRARWHRAFAKLSFFILPMLVITGLFVVHAMLAHQPIRPGNPFVMFAFADLTSLVYLLMYYVMAIVYRRDPSQHQRFMLATVLVVFPPALGRVLLQQVPLHWTVGEVLAAIYLVSDLIIVVLLARDWRRERTVYYAYGFAGVYFLFEIVVWPFLAHYRPWYDFCTWFLGRP